MDADLTDLELLAALKSCSDLAPCSDGIPYNVYKKLWEIAGPFILDAWNHSFSIRVQPLSHRESILVIIPKEGKDIKDPKNWRPITLSDFFLIKFISS